MFEHTILFRLLGSCIMMHLCVSVRVWSVANQLARHGIEHIWIHRLQRYIDQLSGEFNWRYQFTSRNREYVTGWENRFQVIMMMSPCSAEAFPQDLPSHCCQQSLQAHWVCLGNYVKWSSLKKTLSYHFSPGEVRVTICSGDMDQGFEVLHLLCKLDHWEHCANVDGHCLNMV